MTSREVKKVVIYWQKTAEHDYETMLGLFRIKRYSDCLFFGHIVLEKVLKALVVLETKEQAAYTHNLVQLMTDACLDLTDQEKDLLSIVNRFNIRARYPDEKLRFYKMCTKPYSEAHLRRIKALYLKLCALTENKP